LRLSPLEGRTVADGDWMYSKARRHDAIDGNEKESGMPQTNPRRCLPIGDLFAEVLGIR
jgi:hypothetical protein